MCIRDRPGRGGLTRRLRRRGADFRGGGSVLQSRHRGVDDVAALAAGSGFFFEFMQGSAQLGHAGVQRGHAGFQRFDGSAVVGGLAVDALPPLPGAFQLGRSLIDAKAAVFALVFQDGDLALAAGVDVYKRQINSCRRKMTIS